MDCSPLGSSVQRISHARRLEWVAISFSGGSSKPRDQIHLSCIGRCFFFLLLNHQESPSHPQRPFPQTCSRPHGPGVKTWVYYGVPIQCTAACRSSSRDEWGWKSIHPGWRNHGAGWKPRFSAGEEGQKGSRPDCSKAHIPV